MKIMNEKITKRFKRFLTVIGVLPFFYVLFPIVPSALVSMSPVLIIWKTKIKKTITESQKRILIGIFLTVILATTIALLKNYVFKLYEFEKGYIRSRMSAIILRQSKVDSFFRGKRMLAADANNSRNDDYKLEILLNSGKKTFSRRVLANEPLKLPSYVKADFCYSANQIILQKLKSDSTALCEFEVTNLLSQYSIMSQICADYFTKDESKAVLSILSKVKVGCEAGGTRDVRSKMSNDISQLVNGLKFFEAPIEQFIHAHSLNGTSAYKLDNVFFLLQNQGKTTSEDLNTCITNILALLTPDYNFQGEHSSFLPWLNTHVQDMFIISIVSSSNGNTRGLQILGKKENSFEFKDPEFFVSSSTMCYLHKTKDGVFINEF